jgi:hypothetical protein
MCTKRNIKRLISNEVYKTAQRMKDYANMMHEDAHAEVAMRGGGHEHLEVRDVL